MIFQSYMKLNYYRTILRLPNWVFLFLITLYLPFPINIHCTSFWFHLWMVCWLKHREVEDIELVHLGSSLLLSRKVLNSFWFQEFMHWCFIQYKHILLFKLKVSIFSPYNIDPFLHYIFVIPSFILLKCK